MSHVGQLPPERVCHSSLGHGGATLRPGGHQARDEDTKHTGDEKDWAVWCLRFEACTGLLGFEESMAAASAMQ
eukprot:2838787-Heterocapsa_arctica.AAC.1